MKLGASAMACCVLMAVILPVEFFELWRAAARLASRNCPAHGELHPGFTAGPGTPDPRMGVWGSAKP